MGKWGIGIVVVALAGGALALQGCHRAHDDGGDQTSAETQVAPPMANVTAAPVAPKPVAAKPSATVPTAATMPSDAQMNEDAAATGMTSRTGGAGGYSATSSTVTSTTTTRSTTTSPTTPASSAPN